MARVVLRAAAGWTTINDAALSGLGALESDVDLRRKYLDFVDQYARLSEAERLKWRARHPREKTMSYWDEMELKGKAEGREEGKAEGMAIGKAEGREEGKAEGAIRVLLDLVKRGHLSADIAREQLESLVASGELPAGLAEAARARLPSAH